MSRNFTPSQLDAIRWDKRDACVIAGPGSGKTTVLVERYRSLVEEEGFEPHEILAITFTEKAAANMRVKLAEEFARRPLLQRDLEAAWVSTIHGFCSRLLRENSIAAGVDPRFIQLDAREADELQFECMQTALDQIMEERRDAALELIESLAWPDTGTALVSAYDAIRSSGLTLAEVRAIPSPTPGFEPAALANDLLRHLNEWPDKLTDVRRLHREDLREWARRFVQPVECNLAQFMELAACPLNLGRVPPDTKPYLKEFRVALDRLVSAFVDRWFAPQRELLFDILDRFESLYNDRKAERRALDFSDLERRSIELLENHSPTRDHIRYQFLQVMLDEFQDINEQQARLINLVRNERTFFAVGDVNQSIYGFRHARPEIFHSYIAEIRSREERVDELFDNFRSREAILRTVEAVTNGLPGITPRELKAGKEFPPRESDVVEAWRVTGEDKDQASAREGAWIAHRIAELRGNLTLASGATADYSDFAILCRNSDSMTPILEALDRWQIPYVCGRRQSYLVSREGRDVTALLSVILNPRDTIALATVLRSPLVALSDEGLFRLRTLASSLSSGLGAAGHDDALLAAFTSDDAARIRGFIASLKRWREEAAVVPLDVLLSRILTTTGATLTPNLESYLKLARQRGAGHNLGRFLRLVANLSEARPGESELADADQGNCVQVMTVHAAKGLEFPVIILAAMDKGVRANAANVTFTPDFGLGFKWRRPGTQDSIDDSWQAANSEAISEREKQESNRLLYVGMTRAEEHLILSYAKGGQPSAWSKLVDTLPQLRTIDADPPGPDASPGATAEGEQTVVLSRPAVSGQHDTTVNVTSLAVFAQCPRRYYLQRYIGWQVERNARRTSFEPDELPAEDEASTPAAELGSLVHNLLAGKPGDYPAEAHALAAVFTESQLGHAAATAARLAREWDFILDMEGTLVRGIIDLWFEDANGDIVIVDYKTDSKVEPSHYAPQLALYAIALERALGRRPARAVLHYLRFNRIVDVPLTDTASCEVGGLLTDLRAAQHTLTFPIAPDLAPEGHCRTCPYFRGLCPAGAQTAAEQSGILESE